MKVQVITSANNGVHDLEIVVDSEKKALKYLRKLCRASIKSVADFKKWQTTQMTDANEVHWYETEIK